MNRLPASPLVNRALAVAEKHLAWRLGHATMPEYKFLRLVDVLTELDPSWVEWDELKPRG